MLNWLPILSANNKSQGANLQLIALVEFNFAFHLLVVNEGAISAETITDDHFFAIDSQFAMALGACCQAQRLLVGANRLAEGHLDKAADAPRESRRCYLKTSN